VDSPDIIEHLSESKEKFPADIGTISGNLLENSL
jgi:hypothetical protein